MDRLREMEVFVAIVDGGGFTRASEKLGLSTAAVSRALNSLEARIGAQLVARTTRSVRPTDAGTVYLDTCRQVLDAVADADASIGAYHVKPVGTLTISAPVLFGQRFVAPLINAFALRYPDVGIHAVYVDRTTRLLEEGVDVAIRIGHLGDSTTFAVPLGFVRRRTYAAPAYLEARGEPVHPRELTRHDCVSFTGVTHPLEWVFAERGARLPVRLQPRMIVDLAPAADRRPRWRRHHAVAFLSGGARRVETQTAADIDGIRDRSHAGKRAACGASRRKRKGSRASGIRDRDLAQEHALRCGHRERGARLRRSRVQ